MANKMLVSIRGQESTPEPVVPIQLYLEKNGDHVNLRGQDAKGNNWFLAGVYPDGLHIMRNLPTNIGWPLGKFDRINLIDDETGETIE